MNELPIDCRVMVKAESSVYYKQTGQVAMKDRRSGKWMYYVRWVGDDGQWEAAWFSRVELRKESDIDVLEKFTMNSYYWYLEKIPCGDFSELIAHIIHDAKCIEKSRDRREQLGDLFVFLCSVAYMSKVSLFDAGNLFLTRNKNSKWSRTEKKGAPFKRESDRRDMAERIAAYIKDGLAENSCDGEVDAEMDDGLPYYFTLWSKGIWSGQVSVHGDKFIRVEYSGQQNGKLTSDNIVFDTEDSVLAFLQIAFKEDDFISAMKVERKPDKSALVE